MEGKVLDRRSPQRVPLPHVMKTSGTCLVSASSSGPVHRVVAAYRMATRFSWHSSPPCSGAGAITRSPVRRQPEAGPGCEIGFIITRLTGSWTATRW